MRGTSKREDPAAWMIKVTELELSPGQEGCRFETSFEKRSRNSQNPEWTRRWHFRTEHEGTVTIGWEEINFDGKVLYLIQDGLRTVKDLAEEMHSTKSTIHRALERLLEAKLIERRGSFRSATYEPRGSMNQ